MSKCYYNGHLLPQILQDESKPFSYVVKVTETSGEVWYLRLDTDFSTYVGTFNTIMVALFPTTTGNINGYEYHPETSEEWVLSQSLEVTETSNPISPLGDFGDTYELVYTNVDIHIGSAMSGDIYLEASAPILYQEKEWLLYESTITGTCNAIREKTGETGEIDPSDWAEKIRGISSGGGTTEDSFAKFKIVKPLYEKPELVTDILIIEKVV